MTLKLKLAAGIVLSALAFSTVGLASRPADPPKPTDKDAKRKLDPWVGEFRVYEGNHRDGGVAKSARFGGKVTITAKGDGYVFEAGARYDLRKVDGRLEPVPESGYPKWIELGENDADGSPVLIVVGSFHQLYLVRGKLPASWAVLPGEVKPGRGPKPPGAAATNWKAIREYRLDGTDSVWVDDHPELRVESLTLTAWVNTSDAGLMQPVVAKAQAKGNWCSYMLRVQGGGRVSLAVENVAGERSAHWTTKGKLAAKKWHHVAATWSNSKGNASDAKVYVDGIEQQLEMNRAVNYGKDFRIGYADAPLYIGRDEMPSGHFSGTLKDVDVLDRVLTAEEVKALAAKGVK